MLKWGAAYPGIDPLAASLISVPLGIECFRAGFRIASALPGEAALALLTTVVAPSDQPAVSPQMLGGWVELGGARLCSLQGTSPGPGLLLCQRS